MLYINTSHGYTSLYIHGKILLFGISRVETLNIILQFLKQTRRISSSGQLLIVLTMDVVNASETSINFYETTRRSNP